MEFLSEYLQVLVTLAVILGTAVIAGICDALKTNNENLRAELLEMQLRLDQVGIARTATMATSGTAQSAPAPAVEEPETPASEDPHRRPPRASRMRRAAAAAGREPRRAPSADAIAVMQQGLQMAGAGTGASTRPAASIPEISAAPRNAIEPAKRKDETLQDAETLATSEARAATAASPASRQDEEPVQPLMTSQRRTLVPEEVASELPPTRGGIPAGFQDSGVLTRLVQQHQRVSGLVVSVGIAPGPGENETPPSAEIEQMIRSLLGNEDFAAPSARNEYLLIFPNQRGTAAQRKLRELTQQLWDYQNQTAETCSVLFRWGGVEVHAEAIDAAISSASERMRQTRRNSVAMAVQTATAEALRQAG